MRFGGVLVYGANFASGQRRHPFSDSPANAIDAPHQLHEPPPRQGRHLQHAVGLVRRELCRRRCLNLRRVGQVRQASPIFTLCRMMLHCAFFSDLPTEVGKPRFTDDTSNNSACTLCRESNIPSTVARPKFCRIRRIRRWRPVHIRYGYVLWPQMRAGIAMATQAPAHA